MKAKCNRCGWKGWDDDLLIAKNPFREEWIIQGCPNCKDVNTIEKACSLEGCWQTVTSGTPTKEGYKFTCSIHIPKEGRNDQGRA